MTGRLKRWHDCIGYTKLINLLRGRNESINHAGERDIHECANGGSDEVLTHVILMTPLFDFRSLRSSICSATLAFNLPLHTEADE